MIEIDCLMQKKKKLFYAKNNIKRTMLNSKKLLKNGNLRTQNSAKFKKMMRL